MMVLGTNPVPVTETVVETAPVRKLAGLKEVITGAGLLTVRSMTGPELLVAVPLMAMTASRAPWFSCEAARWPSSGCC
jgi:hypothetical protein